MSRILRSVSTETEGGHEVLHHLGGVKTGRGGKDRPRRHGALTLLQALASIVGVDGPAGVDASGPPGVLAHVHRPAQRQQELQEVVLDVGRGLDVPQNLHAETRRRKTKGKNS